MKSNTIFLCPIMSHRFLIQFMFLGCLFIAPKSKSTTFSYYKFFERDEELTRLMAVQGGKYIQDKLIKCPTS